MLDAQAGPITRPKPVNLRHCMRIATWNVLSLSHPGYVTAVARELDQYKVKLAGLTETRIPGSATSCVENFTMLHSGNTGRTAGVALLLHRSIQHSLVSWTPISDRLLQARLTHQHGKLTVIVAYAPTEDSADYDKDVFYNQLQSAVLSTSPHDQLIVLGDLNAVSGTTRQGFESVVGPYGSGVANDNSFRLLTLCSTANLSILGSWFARRNIYRHTWISNDGRTRKEIDHVLTRDRSLFKSLRVYRGAEAAANTDHHLVIAVTSLRPFRAPKQAPSVRLDVAAMKTDPSLAQRYNVAVSNAFDALGELSDDVEVAWQSVHRTILSSAEATLPRQTSRKRPWLSSDTLEVLKRKRDARLAGQSQEHRRLKGVFKAKAKADLETHYSALADEVEIGLQRNDLRPAYRAIKQMRGGCERVDASTVPITKDDGTPCISVDEVLERWNEHYQQMLNHAPATQCPELDDAAAKAAPADDVREDAPTLEEVQKAIRKLRNGRAAGSDEITPELLKNAEIPVSVALHRLFLLIWKFGKVPMDWKEAVIISLYKGKGSRTACSSYRPISLLSVPGKVFAHVLLERLQPLLTRHRRPQQSGFTQSRSTIDAILALRLLAEIHREFGKPLHAAYIDIKAAFDSVDRQALWKALHATGAPQFLIQLIQDLHTGTTSRVRVGRKLSKAFKTSSGVRQGCILAPALFCLAIDWIMSRCSGNLGIKLGDAVFTDLDYADDAVLFAEDPGQWQTELKRFDDAATTMGLHTSWEKTKLQNIGHGPAPQSVSVDGHPVAATDTFVYLGSTVDSSGYSRTDILRRIGLASSVMGQLDRVWRQNRLSLATKLRIYTTCVLAVGLHGAETWTLLKEDSRRLQAFHMTSQRRILGIRWNDFITNRAVADSTNLPSILITIAARRHSIFGHIRRLPDCTPAHTALKLAVNTRSGDTPLHGWNRPAGRPRATWTSQIVRDTGLTAADAWTVADDRSTWRALRPIAGYAQQ